MRILITGSRDWEDRMSIDWALWEVAEEAGDEEITVVHGGATGADTIAGERAAAYGWNVEVHSAEWDKHGKAAGPIRNQKMVDLGADICLAFPLGVSRGTRDCMRRARAAGIRVRDCG